VLPEKVADILEIKAASSGPSINNWANSSRISGASLAVSAARAAATITAVVPTLVAISQLSLSVLISKTPLLVLTWLSSAAMPELPDHS
jgi:hypothetical protein